MWTIEQGYYSSFADMHTWDVFKDGVWVRSFYSHDDAAVFVDYSSGYAYSDENMGWV